MSTSLNILKQLLLDKGGSSAQPLAKNLVEVRNSINNMMNYRNATNCQTHVASQYTGKLSLSNLKDYANANIKGCQCNAQQVTACTCDSRTACDCQNRNFVPACVCDVNCVCNGKLADNYYWEPAPLCYCQSRTVLGNTYIDNICSCNTRTHATQCNCVSRDATCNCNSQAIPNCECDSRTSTPSSICTCNSVTGAPVYADCECQARSYTSTCNCNVRTGTCDSVAACQCNTKEVFA